MGKLKDDVWKDYMFDGIRNACQAGTINWVEAGALRLSVKKPIDSLAMYVDTCRRLGLHKKGPLGD